MALRDDDADVVVEFEATPEQQEMIFCPAPMQIWVCGRRWGKTLTLRHKVCQETLGHDDHHAWYISLTYEKSKKEYRRFTRVMDEYITWKGLQPVPEVHLFNGSSVSFLSMDRPEGHRGEGVHLLMCDEAAKYKPEDFWEILYPTTSDTNGQIILASTFYGENWFYHEYLKGKQGEQFKSGEYKSFLYTSETGYAFQGPSGQKRLARDRRTVPPVVWEQEYMCVPSVGAAAVFRFVERVIGGAALLKPDPERVYIIGWDTGGKKDPSAVVVMDDLGNVVHFEILNDLPEATQQLARVKQIERRFTSSGSVPIVAVDITGTNRDWSLGFAREQLRNVIGCEFAPANKEKMVQQLALEIERGAIRIPKEFVELISQLKSYRYVLRTTRYDYCAPDGMHDDAVAALLMCVWIKFRGYSGAQGEPLSEALT